MRRKFVAYFWFVGWEAISLGMHIDISLPNYELHIPFGFIRIGWVKVTEAKPINWDLIKHKGFGLLEY